MATFATHGKMKASFYSGMEPSELTEFAQASGPAPSLTSVAFHRWPEHSLWACVGVIPTGTCDRRAKRTGLGCETSGLPPILFSTITQTKPGRGSNGNGLRERDGLYHDGIALSQSKGPFAGSGGSDLSACTATTVKTGYVPAEGYRQVPRPIIKEPVRTTL